MRSARIAEWILALFLEPDRAAAYIGDLMEEAAEHSFIWFWSSVARLAIMRFWYDVSGSPLFLVGVLLRAPVLNFALDTAIILGSTVLMVLLVEPRREVAACIAMCAAQPLLYKHYLVTPDGAYAMPGAPELPRTLIWLTTYAGFLAGGLRTRLRSTTQ